MLRRAGEWLVGRVQENIRNFLPDAWDGLTSSSREEARKKVQARRERQRASLRQPPTKPEVQAFIDAKLREYRRIVDAERSRGNTDYIYPKMVDGWVGNQYAIIRFGMNNDKDRVDIFYGGNTGNPMDDGNGHGHVLIKNGTVVSWLEPTEPGAWRNRLY